MIMHKLILSAQLSIYHAHVHIDNIWAWIHNMCAWIDNMCAWIIISHIDTWICFTDCTFTHTHSHQGIFTQGKILVLCSCQIGQSKTKKCNYCVLFLIVSTLVMHLSMSCPRGGGVGHPGAIANFFENKCQYPHPGAPMSISPPRGTHPHKSPPIKYNFWSNGGAKRRETARSARYWGAVC